MGYFMQMWVVLLALAWGEDVIPPPPFVTPALVQPPESRSLEMRALVFCFSPEVKVRFGKGATRVALYPAAHRLRNDWQRIVPEPDVPRAFNMGGAQEP